MLLKLQSHLNQKGIILTFARVHYDVKDKMLLTGLTYIAGSEHFYNSIDEGAKAFENINLK